MASSQGSNRRNNQRSINEGIRKVIGSSNRGFASMDPERQRSSVTPGGSAARETGNAHALTSEQDLEVPDTGGKASTGGGGNSPKGQGGR